MAVNNSLANRTKKGGFSLYLNSDAVKNQINSVVGGKNGPRFISSIISAVNVNPALQECSHQSILSAALLGEALKLSPSPQLGQFYMVPFNDKTKGKVAQFQLGYKGYIQLALRSGQYRKLNVLAIKEGELIRYDPLAEEIEVKLIEDEEERENAPTIGYYAFFEYLNGYIQTKYGMKHKVSYADYVAGNYPQNDSWMYSSFWYRDFDGMAFKTMLRQLISKWGVMSIEMISALDKDMTVINADGSVDYVEEEEPAAGVTVEPVDVQEVQEVVPEAVPDQAGADPGQEEAPGAEEEEGLVFE